MLGRKSVSIGINESESRYICGRREVESTVKVMWKIYRVLREPFAVFFIIVYTVTTKISKHIRRFP